MKRIFVYFFIVLLCCSNCKQSFHIVLGELPEDELGFQKMIIGQLAGNQEIKTLEGEDLVLRSRWDKKQKSISMQYLSSLLNKLNLKTYTHDYVMPNSNIAVDFIIEPLKGTNIYTILPSTQTSDEYVVIGAHYDTDGKNFPGAIDNGSGVALISSVLRQARRIKSRNKHLIVVYFDQEEENISAGSLAFAKFLKDNKYNVHSVHTFDLIGWDGDKNKEVQLELPVPNPKIEAIYNKKANLLNVPIYSIKFNGSDYSSFFKEGFNTLGISQAFYKGDVSGKKDSPEDKFHLVDFEYLESTTTLAFEVIKEILNE